MAAKVKFFPEAKCKRLTHEEYMELKELQYMITGARNERDNRIKNMPPYWQAVERSLWHQQFTSKIRLVDEHNK